LERQQYTDNDCRTDATESVDHLTLMNATGFNLNAITNYGTMTVTRTTFSRNTLGMGKA
jgi:hypothetical protein